uniref:RNA polymerase II subunit A C-terminal domain phosphatase SSU72 n=1 Tax=Sarcophilus harrisii TaxID=9305 RepID=G3WLD3_SARHA
MPSSPLKVAVVCSSNQNRSMEAHRILKKRGFCVRSFGAGTSVRLPGPTPYQPNVYDFKTTYHQMYNDLLKKDEKLYTNNGVLNMLSRNKRIKPRPERFQNCRDEFDLIITCEEKDQESLRPDTLQPVQHIHVDIQDKEIQATVGACQCIQKPEDVKTKMYELLPELEEGSRKTLLHTLCFY